jgi:hypothetical protein
MKGNSVSASCSSCPSGHPWEPQLFEEITNLLAEALYKDFQEHRGYTVNSPQGFDRIKSLDDDDQLA